MRTDCGEYCVLREGRLVEQQPAALEQVEHAFRNVATAVEAAGGSFADVAKLTMYVVDWTPDKVAALGEGVGRAAGALGSDPTKAVTLVGVAGLGEPDLLVEVEATAVLA